MPFTSEDATKRRLEELRVSLLRMPSWEIRCFGLVWYLCGRDAGHAVDRWVARAGKPASLHEKVRLGYRPSRVRMAYR